MPDNASSSNRPKRYPAELKERAVRMVFERLAQAGVVNSVGSKGDSYDNALAETVNGLYKAELIRRRRSWRSTEEVELATAAWVYWWNESRLHSACGDIPPAEFEEAYYRQLEESAAA